VEDVAAVGEPADLVVGLELVETDGAGLGGVHQVGELHHGEDFSDQNRRYGVEFGVSGRRIGPRNVRFEKIGDAQVAKHAVDELPEKTQKAKHVEKELREQKLGVAHWETHWREKSVSFVFSVFFVSQRERERERERRRDGEGERGCVI
jgi:hypothetical protein